PFIWWMNSHFAAAANPFKQKEQKQQRSSMAELETIYSYMREFSTELGDRILHEYPPLQSFEDSVSARIDTLLRPPFPAQNIAIMSVAKRWEQFRTALIVAECGTGKTLMSLGAIHVHSQGRPYTALSMVPP